jgi:hypothetical protein
MQANYTEKGIAHFYCPDLYELLDHRHHTEMTFQEKSKYDGGGHSSWSFYWDSGAYHINHPNNGGVPKCSKCGKEMIFVAGDDPSHAART